MTVGQSVSLSVEHHLGLTTRYLLLFDSYGLVFVGRPVWRENGFVFCICCWPSPAQSFSGPSPLRFATFYCLSFATSLYVASYDSQGHGGGIRPRLHTGVIAPIVLLITLRHGSTENTATVVPVVSVGTCLFAKALLSNDAYTRLIKNLLPSSGCCSVVFFEAVTQ
jgi:hypothetical protein